MNRLLKSYCKSTFMALLVVALSSVAMAQKGKDSTTPPNTQPQNLYEAMKAQNVPSTIHATDLTADWHVITVDTTYANSPYYTKGNVLLFGGQQYLIAYHLQTSSDPNQRAAEKYYQDQSRRSRSAPLLLKDSQLALSLVSLSQSKSFHEIEEFDPAKDIAAAPPQILLDRRSSQSNLKQIALAVFMYDQDYDEKIPPMVAARSADDIAGPLKMLNSAEITATTPVQDRLMPYIKSKDVFLQPTTHRPYLPNYKVSGWPDSKFDNPSQTILFYEDAPDAEGMRNVAYADGHVKAISEGEFQYQRSAQGISKSGYPLAAKAMPKAKATPQT